MYSTTQLRSLWGPVCLPHGEAKKVVLHSSAVLMVNPITVEFWLALDRCMAAHNYHPRREDTGAWNCRPITGGDEDDLSLHSFGIAGDFNWRTNPYTRARLITDMPRAMVNAICAIRTKSGHQVFRWGGDWDGNPGTGHSVYDAMHYEIACSPAQILTGLDPATAPSGVPVPVPSPPQVPIPTQLQATVAVPLLAMGDKGPWVTKLQRLLVQFGASVAVDGAFGPQTEVAVAQVQRFAGIDGERAFGNAYVGSRTWGQLIRLSLSNL